MHDWSEKDVDWAGISDAAEYIGQSLIKWGRVGVRQYKEKFGTVRVYCSFGWRQLHDITHPGYAYSQYPEWLWRIDCTYITKVVSLLDPIIRPYHKWLYRTIYRKAIRKWPHLAKEILSGADWSELLLREHQAAFPSGPSDGEDSDV